MSNNQIKKLQTSLPRGGPLDTERLRKLGISSALAHRYVNSRWLERLGRGVFIPESEVDRRLSAPSFVAQGLPALGAASLDAARFGTASPCASKHGTDCLALNFGFRVYVSG